MTSSERVTESKKVWTTLITNTSYLSGLLTLDYSLKKHNSKYPLPAASPSNASSISSPRTAAKTTPTTPDSNDCWSKLAPFSLVEYERVVQLDSDMLVLQNMDELMELELDSPETAGTGARVFAAGHACVCNPLKKKHYPADWIPQNCAFTSQHGTPDEAQTTGPPHPTPPPRLHERRPPKSSTRPRASTTPSSTTSPPTPPSTWISPTSRSSRTSSKTAGSPALHVQRAEDAALGGRAPPHLARRVRQEHPLYPGAEAVGRDGRARELCGLRRDARVVGEA
ncbi:hypothetical protein EYC84_010690 [Monilinia fructicola]|uniref:Uncharacterized protein n=1 Tax=Monilinia fructicola TaxID=38448 RepID=A0A5M9J8L9_MONFR|nr:hypothetical protein EYC84_010690 [Monilinia fructicola]